MRHNLAHKKFNRTTNQRKALLSNLVVELIDHEGIMTTLPKAKAIRPLLEKCITKGRDNTNGTFWALFRFLKNKEAVVKIIKDLAPRFAQRPGGYLRIVKAGYRHGDMAPMAFIEFVDRPGQKIIAQDTTMEMISDMSTTDSEK